MHDRAKLLADITNRLSARLEQTILRVGIDGVDGAGKTMFADELAAYLQSSGLVVIRSSVDSLDPAVPENARYVRGQHIYFERCHPQERATLVINNEDLVSPYIIT